MLINRVNNTAPADTIGPHPHHDGICPLFPPSPDTGTWDLYSLLFVLRDQPCCGIPQHRAQHGNLDLCNLDLCNLDVDLILIMTCALLGTDHAYDVDRALRSVFAFIACLLVIDAVACPIHGWSLSLFSLFSLLLLLLHLQDRANNSTALHRDDDADSSRRLKL